jgi:hypothetical protein
VLLELEAAQQEQFSVVELHEASRSLIQWIFFSIGEEIQEQLKK